MCDKVPQDLSCLKRPALQKLCKRLGLKANGKNVEMVHLLEDYKAKNEAEPVVGDNTSSEPQGVTDVERPQEERGDEGEREGGLEKGEGNEGEECEMRVDVTLPSCSPPRETVHKGQAAVHKEEGGMEEEEEGGIEETGETGNEGEISRMDEDVPLASNLHKEDETEKPETVRNRRLTYSLSPEPTPTLTPCGPAPLLSPPNDVVTPTSGSRKRRRTHSISPSSSLLQSGAISLVTMTTPASGSAQRSTDSTAPLGETITSEENGGSEGLSAADQIMALLDQRVADRKTDPGYVPPSSTTVSLLVEQHRQAGSRIPLTRTTEKTNRAHERLFSKMPSILEYSEKKKKRVFATQSNSATPGPPAKRQKVVAKTPKTPYGPSRKTVKPKTISKIATTVARAPVSAMKPNTKPDFNFTKTPSAAGADKPALTGTANTETAVKNESRPFTFAAKQTTSGKQHIKKHTGKLPGFQWSIY